MLLEKLKKIEMQLCVCLFVLNEQINIEVFQLVLLGDAAAIVSDCKQEKKPSFWITLVLCLLPKDTDGLVIQDLNFQIFFIL